MIYDLDREESWVFRRVEWPSLAEGRDYDMFTDGQVVLSALNDLRASGTLNYIGSIPDDGLVRIYYRFVDVHGDEEMRPIGTFFMGKSSVTHDGSSTSGTVDLESLLRIPLLGSYGRPYVVKKGTNAVAKATAILNALNLKTNGASSSYVLGNDVVYDFDVSWLSIVNDLLSRAGFSSVCPDAYGIMQLAPYVEPTSRKPSWTFRDDDTSIFMPQVPMSDSKRDIPNVVVLTYSKEEESLWAKCSNVDAASDYSIQNRGYEIVSTESVSELSGSTKAARLAELKSKARSKLIDNSVDIEHASLSFPLVPVWPNDAIKLEYLTANLEWTGAIADMTIQVGGHASTAANARRFVRSTITTSEEGGSW